MITPTYLDKYPDQYRSIFFIMFINYHDYVDPINIIFYFFDS